jgi:hypothetical protein
MKWGADGELTALDHNLVMERLAQVDRDVASLFTESGHPHNSLLWGRGQAEEISKAGLDAALEPINRWVEAREQAPGWDAVAEQLNEFLGPSWPGPPYDGDQAATLALCLEMARSSATK